ncbi:uncharacterized protein LTR77_002499 [Saxophila tyrrhenica]|uniref:Alpha-L-arabinofuranosidase n=1 Tax=Saxophila tyrrhenica TaxID=1690608 RepID=A0AAV9PM93_9PEZI|nr:hypothetical protein LTR77_002499 [Saxophila tyrrhenica]
MPSYSIVWLMSLAFAATASAGPCDIYADGNTPCVAAHSTTRALYSSYTGNLYTVTRSDGKTVTVKPLSAGGVANVGPQDSLCGPGTFCQITTIYDQSGRGNHLTPAPPGGEASGAGPNGYDLPARGATAPVTLNGHKAYGVRMDPGMGYRNDRTNGIATGDAPEGMYAVFDGTHYNGGCCFDYGNAEPSDLDTGAGHMEALYFGDRTVSGSGAGSSPWIMADLENGIYSGAIRGKINADPTMNSRFVTAVLKGEQNRWSLRGGNAASGSLSTFYDGARPSGYNPMHKEGAIVLGVGGDNSNAGQGTFYEGVMTAGYPNDVTEQSVQANIVAARYAA